MSKAVVSKRAQAVKPGDSQTKRTNGQVINRFGPSRTIPLAEIAPPPDNVRKEFDEADLEELATSIKADGLLQAILVRPVAPSKTSKKKYEIVFGERRFRAAQRAGLTEIEAHVQEMSDGKAHNVQLVENLQRRALNPLDEADGLRRLMEEEKLDVPTLAQRLAKRNDYVARTLALTNLIEEARKDFRQKRITLAHALEICRLDPEIQAKALKACYECKYVYNEKTHKQSSVPDKTKPARHVSLLKAWLEREVYLNLNRASFKTDDARLRPDGLTCIECPKRTGRDAALFADIKNSDTCLNPVCFKAKLQRYLELKKEELETKLQQPVAFLSAEYTSPGKDTGVLSRGDYQLLERKTDRCQHARQGIFVNGPQLGQVAHICQEATCKDHRGRVPDRSSSYRSSSSRSVSPAKHNERKQELFNIKVAEAVRKRAMTAALKAWSWPLKRDDLNLAVARFFNLIPSEHQQTIFEVLTWEKDGKEKLRFDDKALLAKLAALDDHELARFMMICSVAHYGSNHYGKHWENQDKVIQLSKEREVNYRLIDAEVRLELCAKKYRDAHQAYLEAVKSGKPASKPVVYEQSAKQTPALKGTRVKTKAKAKVKDEVAHE